MWNTPKRKKKQASSEIHLQMIQMLELKDEDLKMAITMLRNSWEMTALMSEHVEISEKREL